MRTELAVLAALGLLGCQQGGSFTLDDDDTSPLDWNSDDDSADDDDTVEPLGCTVLSQYPNCFATDGTFNGQIVVGYSSPAQDILSATDIKQGLHEYGLSVDNLMYYDGEIEDPAAQNLIVVGHFENNTLTDALITDRDIPGTIGRLELYLHPTGYSSLVVDGGSDEATGYGAEALRFNINELPGTTGTFVEMVDGEIVLTPYSR
ncbi:hypothetical protein HOD38_03855 [archaeon]|jgi:hypothetical protein|nr:hypothetical protein [archaeon]MBT4397376.1 hypothetical protein [archaeon]MBT4440756.1 hypothetical protein [archaeon]